MLPQNRMVSKCDILLWLPMLDMKRSPETLMQMSLLQKSAGKESNMEQEKKKKLPTAVYQITWCLTMRERTNTGREERHEEPTKTQKKIKVLLFLNSLSYLLKMQRVLTTNKEQLCSCQMDMVGETLKWKSVLKISSK